MGITVKMQGAEIVKVDTFKYLSQPSEAMGTRWMKMGVQAAWSGWK